MQTKSCTNRCNSSFYIKCSFSKQPKKSPLFLGYFCKQILLPRTFKICPIWSLCSQSSHTFSGYSHLLSSPPTFISHNFLIFFSMLILRSAILFGMFVPFLFSLSVSSQRHPFYLNHQPLSHPHFPHSLTFFLVKLNGFLSQHHFHTLLIFLNAFLSYFFLSFCHLILSFCFLISVFLSLSHDSY